MPVRLLHRLRSLARARAAGDRGYTLVVLAVAVTVMSVLVAAALPHWSQAMQREREEELIFRGWQYAEAIRVFSQRTGRLPTSLKELMEVKPRSIRKLWKDPMSEDGTWALVVHGLAPNPNPNNPNPNPNPGDDNELPGGGDDSGGQGGLGGSPGGLGGAPGTPIGPITGVRSRSKEESLKMLFGKEKYSEWEFTVEALVTGGKSGGGGAPILPPGTPPRPGGQNPNPLPGLGSSSPHPQLPKARWIGRPFREGLQPGGEAIPPSGTLPGGGQPGGGIGPGTKPPPPNDNSVGDEDN